MMFMLAFSAAMVDGQGTLLFSNSANNLIKNGSFEAIVYDPDLHILDWTWNRCLVFVQPYDNIPAAEGDSFPLVCGSIWQDVPTTGGQMYRVTFAFGGNDQDQINRSPLHVLWENREVLTVPITPAPFRAPKWQYLSVDVTAQVSPSRLEFATFPSQAMPMIDNVSVVAVPEPTVGTLAVVGGALIISIRSRRPVAKG
jgi:hypothetical protein